MSSYYAQKDQHDPENSGMAECHKGMNILAAYVELQAKVAYKKMKGMQIKY